MPSSRTPSQLPLPSPDLALFLLAKEACARKLAAVDPARAGKLGRTIVDRVLDAASLAAPAVTPLWRTGAALHSGMQRPTGKATLLQKLKRLLFGGYKHQGRMAHLRDAFNEHLFTPGTAAEMAVTVPGGIAAGKKLQGFRDARHSARGAKATADAAEAQKEFWQARTTRMKQKAGVRGKFE